MISHQVSQEISFDRCVEKKVNRGLEKLIYKERLKVLHVCYLCISQGGTESTCMPQQGVNAGGWGRGVGVDRGEVCNYEE